MDLLLGNIGEQKWKTLPIPEALYAVSGAAFELKRKLYQRRLERISGCWGSFVCFLLYDMATVSKNDAKMGWCSVGKWVYNIFLEISLFLVRQLHFSSRFSCIFCLAQEAVLQGDQVSLAEQLGTNGKNHIISTLYQSFQANR